MLKQNFGWALSMWAGRHIVGNLPMHNFQYQFKINWFINEEILGSSAESVGGYIHMDLSINLKEDRTMLPLPVSNALGWVMWIWMFEIDRVVIRDVQDYFEVYLCINEEVMLKQKCWWAWSATISSYTISTRTLNVAQMVQYLEC
ncbi:hypothetical protein DPMN_140883 [Dreissena polymorpha]|uniref:Uncharacterized protein n=1 Tax=Dreissena polymorpha TaxID=45954 RepID=A0A9D4JH29_DREPO|nr:hypothetical protein DPMN_140883 [Dreissena polymorpha]